MKSISTINFKWIRIPQAFFLLFLFAQTSFAQHRYAVTNVSVIPMDRDTMLNGQTVLISNGRISAAGPSSAVKTPQGYTVVDGSGKFLMPGLTDMHVHFFEEQYDDHRNTCEAELKTMLANGLTCARIMAGHPDYLDARKKLEMGKWIGPELNVASPQLVGAWPWPPEFKNYEIVDSREKASAAVRRFKKEGYDAIKITFMVNRECYDAIVATAAEVKIKVVGHVGPKVKLPAALAAGEQIEHMDEFIDMLLPDTSYNHGESVSDMNLWRMNAWKTVPFLDESKMPQLVKMVKDAGVYVTPTNFFFISCFGTAYTDDVYKARPDYQYIPAELLPARWITKERQRKMSIPNESLQKYVELRKKMTFELWKAGVPLMAGSDSPEWFLVPGFSIHDEIEMFVTAGLSNFGALQTATVTPAEFLGMKSKGKVKKGMDADLVLLDKNPLDDIRNTRSIAAVFKSGVLYDKKALQGMLLEGKQLGK